MAKPMKGGGGLLGVVVAEVPAVGKRHNAAGVAAGAADVSRGFFIASCGKHYAGGPDGCPAP